ncbi:MAG: (2Fe-2S)-binding protein [Devosia sp.]
MFRPRFIPRGFAPVSPMLICQCNVITDREIVRVIKDLLADDPWQIIVPAKVYRELEKRCKCSGCVPNVVDLITSVTHEYHLELADTPAAVNAPPVTAPPRRKFKGAGHERRSAGHRTSQ